MSQWPKAVGLFFGSLLLPFVFAVIGFVMGIVLIFKIDPALFDVLLDKDFYK